MVNLLADLELDERIVSLYSDILFDLISYNNVIPGISKYVDISKRYLYSALEK